MSSATRESAPPMLTDLLYRHCLARDGMPADHARGLLAELRKLLSDARAGQGLFALGKIGFRDWDDATRTLAAIFALHPHRPGKSRNFGATCRDLACRNKHKPGDSPFDPHFRRILASRTVEELLPPLVSAARLAKTSGVSIDHRSLEWDLRKFRAHPDAVLESWVKSYFDTREPGAGDETAATPTTD